jgi:hypothetical protein
MKRTKTQPVDLAPLFEVLGDCLTPKSAKRFLAMKPDKDHVARMAYLADRSNEGLLTPEEHAEYRELINFGTLMSILQSKARRFLAETSAA